MKCLGLKMEDTHDSACQHPNLCAWKTCGKPTSRARSEISAHGNINFLRMVRFLLSHVVEVYKLMYEDLMI